MYDKLNESIVTCYLLGILLRILFYSLIVLLILQQGYVLLNQSEFINFVIPMRCRRHTAHIDAI